MLVKITDTKGRDYWINPIYVRAVLQGKGGGSEIRVGFSVGLSGGVVKTDASPEEVAQAIDQAMPEAPTSAFYGPIVEQQSEEDQASQQAATGAVSGGAF